MKKLLKFSVSIAAAALLAVSMTACGKKHEHTWSWHRTETEHWQECTSKGCDAKNNYGTHDEDCKTGCETCADYKVIAFGFISSGDSAHADFAREANEWFPTQGKKSGFTYTYSNTVEKGWADLNEENIENYDLIILLNDKPSDEASRMVFRDYMEDGGACVAFHAAGFAMWANSDVAPSEWDGWFSNTLLGSGVYGDSPRDPSDRGFTSYWNTWNPTSEPMTIETYDHFATENIDVDEFISAPCEWYEWHHNLFENNDITVLVSMNPTPENPAGDDPRKGDGYAHQIWEGGHHAIAWANKNYNMVYMNWGHNLQDYNDGEFGKSSKTFSSEVQNRITIDAITGLLAR